MGGAHLVSTVPPQRRQAQQVQRLLRHQRGLRRLVARGGRLWRRASLAGGRLPSCRLAGRKAVSDKAPSCRLAGRKAASIKPARCATRVKAPAAAAKRELVGIMPPALGLAPPALPRCRLILPLYLLRCPASAALPLRPRLTPLLLRCPPAATAAARAAGPAPAPALLPLLPCCWRPRLRLLLLCQLPACTQLHGLCMSTKGGGAHGHMGGGGRMAQWGSQREASLPRWWRHAAQRRARPRRAPPQLTRLSQDAKVGLVR